MYASKVVFVLQASGGVGMGEDKTAVQQPWPKGETSSIWWTAHVIATRLQLQLVLLLGLLHKSPEDAVGHAQARKLVLAFQLPGKRAEDTALLRLPTYNSFHDWQHHISIKGTLHPAYQRLPRMRAAGGNQLVPGVQPAILASSQGHPVSQGRQHGHELALRHRVAQLHQPGHQAAL